VVCSWYLALFSCWLRPPAWAGRPVTADERAKLSPAIAAEGCSGGKLEFDDGKYEVDDAMCNDGQTYELKFDAGFRLVTASSSDSACASLASRSPSVCWSKGLTNSASPLIRCLLG
jgi:hypothetical protein